MGWGGWGGWGTGRHQLPSLLCPPCYLLAVWPGPLCRPLILPQVSSLSLLQSPTCTLPTLPGWVCCLPLLHWVLAWGLTGQHTVSRAALDCERVKEVSRASAHQTTATWVHIRTPYYLVPDTWSNSEDFYLQAIIALVTVLPRT